MPAANDPAIVANIRQNRGRAGEEAAAQLLIRAGMRILARNWRYGRFELDLVCRDGNTLVFVEVRTRAAGGMLLPAESLTPAKKRHFLHAARAYLAENDQWNCPCRFDVVCVIDAGETLQLNHYRHVDLSEFMGGGNTSWQPW